MENIEFLEQKYLDILRIKNNLTNRIDQLEWYILRCGLDLPVNTGDEFVYSSDSAHARKRVRYSSVSSNWENRIPKDAVKRDSFSHDNNVDDVHEENHNESSFADTRNQRAQARTVPNLYTMLPNLSDIQAQITDEVENRIAIELGNIQKNTKVTIDEDLDIFKQQIYAQISDAIQTEMGAKLSNQLEEVRSHIKNELQSLAAEQYGQKVHKPKENITSRADKPESNHKGTDFESQKKIRDELFEDSNMSDGPRHIRNQSKQEFDAPILEKPLDVQRSQPSNGSKNASHLLDRFSESKDVLAPHEHSLSDSHLSAAEPKEQVHREVGSSLDASRRTQDHYEPPTLSKKPTFPAKGYNQETDTAAYQTKKENFNADVHPYDITAKNKDFASPNVKISLPIENRNTSTPRKPSSAAASKIVNKDRYPHTSLLSQVNINMVSDRNQTEERQQNSHTSPGIFYTSEVS